MLQGNTQMRRNGLVISGMQFTPGFPGTDAIYWAWVNRMVALDLAISAKRYNEEGAVPLERFQVRLEERGGEEADAQRPHGKADAETAAAPPSSASIPSRTRMASISRSTCPSSRSPMPPRRPSCITRYG